MLAAPASIAASPQNVPFGQFTTTLTFATGSGAAGIVCVAANGAAEGPFAGAPTGSGSASAPFIQSGSYLFTLHAGGDCTGAALAATTVHKLTPDGTIFPSITVTPPSFVVRTGFTSNTATVNWDVGNGMLGVVIVQVNGSSSQPTLASATYGSVTVPWVQSGTYTFTLAYGNFQSKAASTVAKSGIAVSPPGAGMAGSTFTVTGNSGDGAPALICLKVGAGGPETPFAVGNSGIVNGTIPLTAGQYYFSIYESADLKTPITSYLIGTPRCTANTPLMLVDFVGLLVT